MKYLKFAVIACSLSVVTAAAYAQNAEPAANVPQQAAPAGNVNVVAAPGDAAKPAKKDACVGPASFCNIYFGS